MAISNNNTGIRTGVCTSTTRPTAPYEGQMIYETDTDLVYLWNGTAWVEINSALTKAPRGLISVTSVTSSSGSISAMTTRITVPSFTAVANRYYRITYFEPVLQYVSGTVNYVEMSIKIGGVAIQFADVKSLSNTDSTGTVSITKTLSAGATVVTGVITPSGGNINAYSAATAVAQIVIEDIGAA